MNLTVLDDEDVRVGSVHYSVVKVSDDGVFTSAVSGRTSDGRAKFSYLAPSSSGTAQFLVRTWNEKADGTRGTTQTAREQILIEVGEAMPEEPDMPAMPDGDATLTVQGNIGSFSGGSLDAFAAAAAAECPGGSQIAVQDADGEWHLWSSTAPAFAIIGFTTAFADGFDGMTFVWVSSCEADAHGQRRLHGERRLGRAALQSENSAGVATDPGIPASAGVPGNRIPLSKQARQGETE